MTEIDIEKLPKELSDNRNVIECNFIMGLYKDPSLLFEYKNVVNGEDIISPDGMFYMSLLQNMVKAGYDTIDNLAVYSYLEKEPKIKKIYEQHGGWSEIQQMSGLVSLNNMDKYYDDLVKSNLMIRLDMAGFPILKDIEKFNEMNSEEVYDYFEYQLSNISIGKIKKIKPVNLSDGYKEFIEGWDKGGEIGFPISSKMLNYQTLGIHKSNLTLHLAGIGIGKSTSAIAWYVLPAIEQGENVVIVANEQDESSWRQMVLSTVLFNKLGRSIKNFDRHKMLKGGYSDEQIDDMHLAEEWLKKQKGKLVFIETQDYGVSNVRKIITRFAKRGVGLFLYDTLKPMNDASERSWGEFSEVAKELFLQAKRCKVAVIATAQLSPEGMARKYLDLTCVGKAKAIAETANTVIMFRPLTENEKSKIKPYTFKDKIKIELELDPNKDYIMVFYPKNRYGSTYPQIIMERNMNFNSYKDIGWYTCDYDTFSKTR